MAPGHCRGRLGTPRGVSPAPHRRTAVLPRLRHRLQLHVRCQRCRGREADGRREADPEQEVRGLARPPLVRLELHDGLEVGGVGRGLLRHGRVDAGDGLPEAVAELRVVAFQPDVLRTEAQLSAHVAAHARREGAGMYSVVRHW